MEIPDLLKIYLGSLVSDFLRYFVFAGAGYLLFWVIFKNALKHKFIQRKFPKRKHLIREFGYSVSTVFIFAMVGTFLVKAVGAGYTQMYHNIDKFGYLYFGFSIIAAILIHDTYFYWTHRAMHHPKLYKHVHLVHHKSTNPSPWAAYAFHPYEAVVQAGAGPLILFVLPMHHWAFLAFLTYMIFLNVFGHYSFELFPKGFTRNKFVFWHNTTTHHNMHHRYFNYNYCLYFNWWDRICGTLHPNYDEAFDEVASREKQPAVEKVESAEAIEADLKAS